MFNLGQGPAPKIDPTAFVAPGHALLLCSKVTFFWGLKLQKEPKLSAKYLLENDHPFGSTALSVATKIVL
jgi:hypothetical protein